MDEMFDEEGGGSERRPDDRCVCEAAYGWVARWASDEYDWASGWDDEVEVDMLECRCETLSPCSRVEGRRLLSE